jgi:membrane associated rhomboid family serine protease
MAVSVTIIIIVITVITSLYALSNSQVMSKWLLNPYSISKKGEYYRFISSGFIHADYMHLFFNMLSLYFFGDTVARYFGSIYGMQIGNILFVILYLVSMVAADIPDYLKYRNSPHYNALGASGAVSAVVFSAILFNPLSSMIIFPIPLPIPAFIFGTLYLFYSYYQSKRGGDNIGHNAHLFGALFGLVFTIIVVPNVLTHFIESISRYRPF